MITCIDAGHGGHDPGGQSLGTPEKAIALRYALRLGQRLERGGGVQVLYTRTDDTFVPLSERARIANSSSADVFISVHANASGNAAARGPWTIHAAPSPRGRTIATEVQRALASVLGGSPAAVYPDESPWVGGRRLAVLRQTRMPAVLLELGFTTNAADLAQLEDAEVEEGVCLAVAAAIREVMGAPVTRPASGVGEGAPRPIPDSLPPHLAVPREDPERDMVLEPITVPTAEHVEQAASRLHLAPSALCDAATLVEGIARAMVRGNEGPRQVIAAELLGAFGAFRARRCG